MGSPLVVVRGSSRRRVVPGSRRPRIRHPRRRWHRKRNRADHRRPTDRSRRGHRNRPPDALHQDLNRTHSVDPPSQAARLGGPMRPGRRALADWVPSHVSGMPDCTHWSLAFHPSRSAAGPARTVPACREGNVSREGLRAAWRRGVPKAFRWPGPPQSGNHPGPACSSGSLRRGRSAV
jgi:hypothetical protein